MRLKTNSILLSNALDLMSRLDLSWPETSKEPFRHSHPERLVIFITQATPPCIVVGFNERTLVPVLFLLCYWLYKYTGYGTHFYLTKFFLGLILQKFYLHCFFFIVC